MFQNLAALKFLLVLRSRCSFQLANEISILVDLKSSNCQLKGFFFFLKVHLQDL